MHTTKSSREKSGYVFLFITIFFFSTYEVVSKLIAGKIDPFQINFIRFLIGGLILFAVAIFRKETAISRKDFALCALAGFINVVASMGLINMSLAIPGTSAAVAAVLFSCNPIFVSVFASLFDGEHIDRKKTVSLILGIIGTVLISFNKMSLDPRNLVGPALAVLSAILFALYTVLGKKISARTGSLRMNANGFVCGSLLLLPLLAVMKRPIFTFDPSALGWVLYLSVFVTGLAYLAYFRGLGIAGAGKGSLVFFLKPVLATLLAFVFLGEHINALVVGGIVLILLAIAVGTGSRAEK